MTMSNAQRQAAYRARHLHDEAAGGERLNVVLDASAKRTLERLAACYGVTQRALLQGRLANAQYEALDQIYARPELSRGAHQYYDKQLPVTLKFATA